MHKREWTLVAFTLLMQSSIGATCIVSVALASGASVRAFELSVAAASAAGALALLASLLHLGRPARASLALANVRTSWLSREIVASIVFVVCAGLFALEARAGGRGTAVSLAAAVAGLAAIYAMSRLYMVSAQPAWNRLLTPLAFFTSALLLGAIVVFATASPESGSIRGLATAASGLLIVQGAIASLYVLGLPREPSAAISGAASQAVWLIAGRAVVTIVAIVLLLAAPAARASAPLTVVALACVLASELAGRVAFYAGRASIDTVRFSEPL